MRPLAHLLAAPLLLAACAGGAGDSGATGGLDGGADGGLDGGTDGGGAADGGALDWGADGGAGDGGDPAHVHASTEARWRALSTGSQHACAIDADGAVACWGYDWDGRTEVPALALPAQAIACGGEFSCALDANGEITCWGAAGAVTAAPPAGAWVELVAGYDYACARDAAGEALCWGEAEHQQLAALEGPWIALSAGRTHACGLAADGTAACWGGQDAPALAPAPPPHDGEVVDYGQAQLPGGRWAAVSAGDYHTCLVDTTGVAVCVGNDRGGETSPPADARFATVSAGGVHSCGITTSGGVRCWGAYSASWDYYQAVEPPGTFLALDTASVYTCGIRQVDDPAATGGQLVCWGALDDLPVQVP